MAVHHLRELWAGLQRGILVYRILLHISHDMGRGLGTSQPCRVMSGQLANADAALQVTEGLIQLAIANEIGSGPTLKEAMEREVQEEVGLPPSQTTAKSGSGHDQKGH